ncbi:MAG: hypothetical protein JWM99_2219 [Verrucomicrobiales bacterium]|nr:hypothetical protein [Verrucomicrobiales bacterium]
MPAYLIDALQRGVKLRMAINQKAERSEGFQPPAHFLCRPDRVPESNLRKGRGTVVMKKAG